MAKRSRFNTMVPEWLRDKLYVYRKAGLGVILVNWLFGLIRRNGRPPFSLHFTSQVTAVEKIKYSADRITLCSFAVSGNCYFQANNGIQIGRNCLFAPGVKIISSNHALTGRTLESQTPVQIGDDVWIGAGAIILPGVVLGNNCTVGAGSVVTKSFPGRSLVIAGNPAKVIKSVDCVG